MTSSVPCVFRSAYCSLPLINYSIVSAVIIFSLGLAFSSILCFGREHPVLQSDQEEQEQDMDRCANSTSGGALDVDVKLMRRMKLAGSETLNTTQCHSQLSLRVLFYVTGCFHLFALLWALLGVYWQLFFADAACNENVKQV